MPLIGALQKSGLAGIGRRLSVIWAKLLSGTVIAQLVNLLTLAIAARFLSMEILGGIVIIQSFVRVVDGVINLKVGTTLTKFGIGLLEDKDDKGFGNLLRVSFAVELFSAALAAALSAAALWLFAENFGVPDDLLAYAPVYALVALVSLPGLHLSVMRVFDRFGLFAGAEVFGAIGRLFAIILVFAFDFGPIAFFLAWTFGDMFARLMPFCLALRELGRHGHSFWGRPRFGDATERSPGFWNMIAATNGTTAVRSISSEGDVVLVGWILGPSAAAIFRIGKAAATPLLQLGMPIQQAAFPELTRFWAQGEKRSFFKHGVIYCSVGAALGLVASICAYFAAPYVIQIMASTTYRDAEPVFIGQCVAIAVYLAGIALLPMASSMQKMGAFFGASVLATIAFIIFAPFLTNQYGPAGMAFASIVHNATWFLATSFFVFRGSIGAFRPSSDTGPEAKDGPAEAEERGLDR